MCAALLSDLSEYGGYSGDYYFTNEAPTTSDSIAWGIQEPSLPVVPKENFTSSISYNPNYTLHHNYEPPNFNFDETFGSENLDTPQHYGTNDFVFESLTSLIEQPATKLKQNRSFLAAGSSEGNLKRGPKFMTLEERQVSKNNFMKLYQDIWRLLFRKNSTVVLTERGKMCCSFYVNQNVLKCPSGKSPDHDYFRTIEHLWNVVYISSSLNTDYALKQYFFMKCLISWKLQPKFTDGLDMPDV